MKYIKAYFLRFIVNWYIGLFRRRMRSSSMLLLKLRAVIVKELKVLFHHIFQVFKLSCNLALICNRDPLFLLSTFSLFLLGCWFTSYRLLKILFVTHVYVVRYTFLLNILRRVKKDRTLSSSKALPWELWLIHWLLVI